MTPEYYAWYEMYPAGSVSVFRVKPGDVINSTVSYAKGKFTLTVGDCHFRKSATKTAACSSCLRVSAEGSSSGRPCAHLRGAARASSCPWRTSARPRWGT